MDEELEAFRQAAIRQLEQEQQYRTTKLRELQQAIAELEAADRAAGGQLLRAQQPLIDASKCLRCWIWDGKRVNLTPLPGTDETDFFRCRACGHEYEAPAI